MRKIRKGDDVIVLAGKDKGKRGTVLRVQPDGKLVVENINIVKKHTRSPTRGKGEQGGIMEKEMPIDISNVDAVQPATREGRPGRIQDPGRRPQGAYLQVRRRSRRRLR